MCSKMSLNRGKKKKRRRAFDRATRLPTSTEEKKEHDREKERKRRE